MTPSEEWRPVLGYEGAYEVSNLGRVRSCPRMVPAGQRGGFRRIAGGERRASTGSGGYLQVTLQRKTYTVHSLVAEAFLGPRPHGQEVCHNNGDKSDNRLANLRYDTVSANRLDTILHGNNVNANRSTCPQGHPYDDANTGYNNRARRCLTCHRLREKARHHRKRTANAQALRQDDARR